MPNIRNITTQWSGGDTVAEVELPTCVVGDQLFIFVGGGNHVIGTPAGWFSDDYLSGQEAQGIVYNKIAEPGDSGSTVNVTFDGTDQRYIAAVASRDFYAYDGNYAVRAGTAGSTFPATTHGWTADAYQGDLVFTFAFVRNGSTPPTLDRGVMWDEQASAGSSAALYIESAPIYEEDSAWELGLPSRSGFIVYQVAVYQRVWSEWIQGGDFQRVQTQLDVTDGVGDVKYHEDSETASGVFPTINQSTFLASQAAQTFSGLTSSFPARWVHDRIIDGGDWTRTWDTLRRYELYSMTLPTASLADPAPGFDAPPDWVGDIEWLDGTSTAGSEILAVESEMTIDDFAFDNTDGTEQALLDGSFATVIQAAAGVTWGVTEATAWDKTTSGTPLFVHPGSLTPGTTNDVLVDLTDALDPSDKRRLAIAVYVTGPGGVGDPTIDLHSYTFEGGANFGADFIFEVSSAGTGLVWTIRPGPLRFEVRRTPPVIIGLPTYVRQFPTSHAGTWGSSVRIFPPPKVQRIIGGHT